MKVIKAVRGMNFIAVVMYRSQQGSWRGQRIVTSQSQEVALCSGLLDVARNLFSWLKNLMAFLSLSLLVESKVSLR